MLAVVREMALGEAEFLRLLPYAVAPHDCTMRAQAYVLQLGGGEIRITQSPMRARKIGSLLLPMLRVTLTFNGIDEPCALQFLQHFDRTYHRGGG